MKNQIEIYVRHSSNGTFLNFHVPSQMKEQFISALHTGSLEDCAAAVAVELAILPEWITDREVRAKVEALDECINLRIPVTSFNVNYGEE